MERFTVEQDGFFGFLTCRSGTSKRTPARRSSCSAAARATRTSRATSVRVSHGRGIAALGLCYWNVPGLPDELIEVSIEPIERAVAYLRQRGFDRVGIYGISKGGELALLAASLMPQITCAVAISPLACTMPGITGNKSLAGKGLSDRSSWTWRGEPVPCARGGGRLPYLGIIRRIVHRAPARHALRLRADRRARAQGGLDCRGAHQRARPSRQPLARRHCGRATRPVGSSSSASPSTPIPSRSRDAPTSTRATSSCPWKHPRSKLFAVERAHPEACRRSREDAFTQTLAFLARW